MDDFIRRGAIRIDDNAGAINLINRPTKEQQAVLRQLIARNNGDVYVDFGDGNETDHSAEYDRARPLRVLGDIDRYFSEGVKSEGTTRYSKPLYEMTDNELDNELTAAQSVIDKPAKIEKLRNSEPASITGNEIELLHDGMDKKRAAIYGRKLQGFYTNQDTKNVIQLQRGRHNGGLNEVLQHDYKNDEHLQSVAAIPQIIEKSIYMLRDKPRRS